MLGSLYSALGWTGVALDGQGSEMQQEQGEKHSEGHSLLNQRLEKTTAATGTGEIQPATCQPAAAAGFDIEDLSSFGYWNLRAAMLNCLPVTMSRQQEDDLDNPYEHVGEPTTHPIMTTAAAAAQQQQQESSTGSCNSQHVDAVKGLPDTPGKQQALPGVNAIKSIDSSAALQDMPRQQQHLQPQPQQQQDVQQDISSNIQGTRPVSSLPLAPDVPAAVAAASELRTAVADAGPLTTAAAATSQAAVPRSSSMVRLLRTSSSGTLRMDAAAAAPGSGGGMPVEALGLQREMRLLAARLAEMTQTMAKLQQENMRLRAGGEEDSLLADAVQQLLAEKSTLQQEVSRLNRQNAALQELLEYTTAATGTSSGGGDNEGDDTVSQRSGACSRGSSRSLRTSPTPHSSQGSRSAEEGAITHAAAQGTNDPAPGVVWDGEPRYWLVTPTCSGSSATNHDTAGDDSTACSAAGSSDVAATAAARSFAPSAPHLPLSPPHAHTAATAATKLNPAAPPSPHEDGQRYSTTAVQGRMDDLHLAPAAVEGSMSREASAGVL